MARSKAIAWVIPIGVLIIAAVAVVAYARLFVDPDELLERLTSRFGPGAPAVTESYDRIKAMAQKTHKGPGPCLRFVSAKDIDPADLKNLASELESTGLVEDLETLTGPFLDWNSEYEKAFHEDSEASEWIDMLGQSAGPWEKILVKLNQGRLQKIMEQRLEDIRKMIQMETGAKLAEVPQFKKDQLRSIWEKGCKSCFTVDGIFKLYEILNPMIAKRRLERLALKIQEWVRKNGGSYPKGLQSIAGKELEEDLKDDKEYLDPWGRLFIFQPSETSAKLISLGADGLPGGESVNQDIEKEVAYPIDQMAAAGGVVFRVTLDQMRVRGILSKEEIAQVVKEHLREVQYCYEKNLLLNPNLVGKIVLEWTVTRMGSVEKVKVTKNSMGSKPVADCVVQAILRWKFPRSESGTVVEYPFIFKTIGF